MSKTRGNDVDPLEVMEKHGTDALRFTLVALSAPGTDPSLGEARLLGYKAFVNKLWNASRFVLMNLEGERASSYAFDELPLASRWILSRLQRVSAALDGHLRGFRLDLVAHEAYHFLWDEVCDWYIESSKSSLADPVEAPRARAVLLEVLESSLKLVHPVMPFVTEEIWQRLPHDGDSIMLAPYPQADEKKMDPAAEQAMERLMALVVAIRTIRSTYEVEPRKRIDVAILAPSETEREFLAAHLSLVRDLARLENLEVATSLVDGARTIRHSVEGFELRIPMAGLFDIAAEKGRLTRERLKIDGELQGLTARLANPQFIGRAKPEVVAESRAKVADLEARRDHIEGTLHELGGEGAA